MAQISYGPPGARGVQAIMGLGDTRIVGVNLEQAGKMAGVVAIGASLMGFKRVAQISAAVFVASWFLPKKEPTPPPTPVTTAGW